MNMPVTVAVADDHPVLLKGMVSLFNASERFRLVGEAVCADTAREMVRDQSPNVLIMDLSMPGDVFGTIRQIAVSHPDTKVVVFTAFCSVDSALKVLDAGATGFVLKVSPSFELFEAIDTVVSGQTYITRQYASQVIKGLRDSAHRQVLNDAIKLSLREKQIVGHLLQARTNREIAAALHISEKTVKHYMTSLMLKLKARNRVEVVIAARQSLESERAPMQQ